MCSSRMSVSQTDDALLSFFFFLWHRESQVTLFFYLSLTDGDGRLTGYVRTARRKRTPRMYARGSPIHVLMYCTVC